MILKNPFLLKPHLYVLLQGTSGSPYAARLNLRRIAGLSMVLGGVLLVTGLGTLLFFRELELNRRLQEQVLELQTREKLNFPHQETAPKAMLNREPVSVDPDADAVVPSAPAEAIAHINELGADCSPEQCAVKLSMTATGQGPVTGQLLLVLETEVPRIGAGSSSTSEVRKRFFLYPGGEKRDELTLAHLPNLKKTSFRFSRALTTSASFNMGKLLRPLAINAYVYDSAGTLIRHERRAVEND